MKTFDRIGLLFALGLALASIPTLGSAQHQHGPALAGAAASGKGTVPTKRGQAPTPASSAPGSAGDVLPVRSHNDNRDREFRIDPTRVADFRTPSSAGKSALRARSQTEKNAPTLPAGVSPVFVDPASPGQVRALPGGVIVALRHPPAGNDALAREAEGRRQIAAAGLHALRPIGPDARRWLVASPAGMPALELANRLHASSDFESATPNWWKPRALK